MYRHSSYSIASSQTILASLAKVSARLDPFLHQRFPIDMALILKIKFYDTMRRWVVYENLESSTFSFTLNEVEAKIRELFMLPQSTTFKITYIDKDDDVITVGDDQDLVDACVVQGLNPLRLNVSEESDSSVTIAAGSSSQLRKMEVFLKSLFPQATEGALQSFMQAYHRYWDPMLPTDALVQKTQEAFRQFLEGFSYHQRAQGMLRSNEPAADPFVVHSAANDTNSNFACTGSSYVASHGHHGVFHRKIQCDGCGMNPIEGTRYKSTKVPNYDLCSNCYAVMGKDSEFQRIEHPVILYHPSFSMRGRQLDVGQSSRKVSPAKDPYGWKSECPFSGQIIGFPVSNGQKKKLDSRFVKDVSISDGSVFLPSSNFRKIWRLRNSGNIPWPKGTRLAHIGGDILSSVESVVLELPEGGLPCGEDIDVSVDLTAPNTSGRHVSHWRLVSPSGQKFGHRVWVLIQVMPHSQQFTKIESQRGMETAVGVEDLTDLVEGVKYEETNPNHEGRDPGSPTSLSDFSNQSISATDIHVIEEGAHLQMEAERDGFSLVEAPVEDTASTNVVTANTFGGVFEQKEMPEESHEGKLALLESMGFLNTNLNLQLLGKNNGDIQGTLDDLLLCDGWGGILKDLEEMGFNDRETNVLLLLEREGSIKHVVKDLVRIEKERPDE